MSQGFKKIDYYNKCETFYVYVYLLLLYTEPTRWVLMKSSRYTNTRRLSKYIT